MEESEGAKKVYFLDAGRETSTVVVKKDVASVFHNGNHHRIYLPVSSTESSALDAGEQGLMTPMPCKISHVAVKAGDQVKKGQTLVVVEAMKMEHVIKSPKDGKIKRVVYKIGEIVEQNKRLIEFDE
jgi:3-methylcrotonyl-CoA carboxylase alpha subunit